MDPNTPVPPINPDPQNPNPTPQPTIIVPTVGQPLAPMSTDNSLNPTISAPAPPAEPSIPSDHPMTSNLPSFQAQSSLSSLVPLQKPSKLRRFLSKKRILLALIPLLLIGSGAGAYLGFIAPNQPQNIWNTALSRTAKGYNKLTEYAAKPRATKGTSLKGSFKSTGSLASDGVIEGSSLDDNGDYKGSISASGLKIGIELKTIKSPGNSPDIYFKLDGLQGLGTLLGGDTPELTDALNSLNNQWYFVDHTFFDQFSPGTNTSTQITSADISSILQAVGGATREYIFTNNKAKAALALKQVIGKEKQDGRSVYHYQADINKQNLKSYIDRLCSNLKSSNLIKFLAGDSQALDQALACDSLKADVDNLSKSKTADVWVDTQTKLVHKIKFNFTHTGQTGDVELFPGADQNPSSPSQENGYVEIYQNYIGGDEFPFGLNYYRESSQADVGKTTTSGTLQLKINMKTNIFDIIGKMDLDQFGDKSGYNLNLTIAPSSTGVQVQKPDKAKTIIELLNDLGFADLFSGVQSSAKDTERKTDINALYGQLEAYQAQNGLYPTISDVNDTAWRQQNMAGLDSEALRDPDGDNATLSSTPVAHIYSYQPLPAGCNNNKTDCTLYTLTATLDDGGTYVKQSLN
ncbi:hypothetical protein HYW35_01215 [Candidatus Saccharibacteria bacterium]|nr:hypothetical protein [Candidatus Saccharibacteria bacterium]